MKIPQLIFTDIDGVWTDGGMYYDQTGNEWKKFNTSDSWGVAFCKAVGIKVAIITGENTKIVKRRADKLKINYCFLGVKNKLQKAEELRNELSLSWNEIAFIGDDINDIELLTKVGLSACPAHSADYVKNKVGYICKKNGGEGVFREYVEYLLLQHYTIEELLEKVK